MTEPTNGSWMESASYPKTWLLIGGELIVGAIMIHPKGFWWQVMPTNESGDRLTFVEAREAATLAWNNLQADHGG